MDAPSDAAVWLSCGYVQPGIYALTWCALDADRPVGCSGAMTCPVLFFGPRSPFRRQKAV